MKKMNVIGRKDKIDLPELGLFEIDAKVDTGAYGCALHCHHIEVKEKNGKEILFFDVLDPDHTEYKKIVFEFEKYGNKEVKNSGGQKEHRYTIKTRLIIFNKEHTVEFSLANRKNMKYPVLLGRKFLSGNFLVNVDLKDISFNQK